jgi:hypothetical protein
MRIIIFLATVTIALVFAIGVVSAYYGPKVAVRFLERGVSYTEDELRAFVTSSPTEARGYAFPVLFPLDLFFMVFLGGFLALASVEAAASMGSVRRVAWIFAVGPALYVAADLIEDVLLARMLLWSAAISQDAVSLARSMTMAKFLTSGYAILQTILLSGIAAVSDL